MMYFTSSILLTGAYIVSRTSTSNALLVPSTPSSLLSTPNQQDDSPPIHIVQQYFALQPPIPILDIGRKHILGQIGENMTKAEKQSINNDHRHPGFSRVTALNQIDTPAQCSRTMPCVDGSCCNSVRLPDIVLEDKD